ncbi:MAG: hypothetical protein AAGJ28_24180, partial [Pseudomonadota bacterium]
GVNLDLSEDMVFRGTGGYFHFERDLAKVAGPKARLEVEISDPLGWDGTALTFGGEFRRDSLRGTDASGFVRFSIPFGSDPEPRASQSKRTRKLGRYVYRDIDIIAPTVVDRTSESVETVVGAAPPPNSAPGTPSAEGEALNVYHVADTAQGAADCSSYVDACTVGIAQADPSYGPGDTLIVVDAGGSTINSDIFLNGDLQNILGGDAAGNLTLQLLDAQNTVLTFNGLGGRVTVGGTVSPENGSTLARFNIDGGAGTALLVDSNVGPIPVSISDVDIIGGATGFLADTGAVGSVAFDSLSSISGVSGTSFRVASPAFETIFDGSINHTGTGRIVDVTGHSTGQINFNGPLTATAGTGIAFDNADGTYQFTGALSLDDTGSASGIGLDVTGGSDGTFTFAEFDITNTSIATPLNTPIASGATAVGIDLNDSPNATFTFTDLDIASAADAAMIARNAGTVSVGSASSLSEISGGTGLTFLDTDATINNVSITAGNTVDPGLIIASPAGSALGNLPIGGQGGILLATENGPNALTVENSQIAGGGGIFALNAGTDDQQVALNNNTITATNGPGVLVMNDRTAATGETYVTAFSNNSITATDIGALFESVVFDADPATMVIDDVAAATLALGSATSRIGATGLDLGGVSGSLTITTLDIYNDGDPLNDFGLLLNNRLGAGDPFTLNVQGGTIDALNSNGIQLVGQTGTDANLGIVLSSLTASGGAEGIRLTNTSGSLQITGTTSITATSGDGIAMAGSSTAVTLGTTSVS